MRSALSGAKLPKTAVTLLAALLIGFAIGSAIYGLSATRGAPRVADAEYVLMVADLYEHEKSVYNARERLAQLGQSPVEIAEASAEAYARQNPEARRDVDALRQLATALRQAEADAPTASGAPAGTMAVVILIAISIALGAGAAWLWKRAETRGVRMPHLRRGEESDVEPEAAPRRFGKLASALATTVGRGATATSTRRNGRTAAHAPVEESASVTASRAKRAPATSTPQVAVERPSFESNYTLGDDPYDSIHPIHDAAGELVGACGLSATEAGDRPGRYFGFTAWLQDYSASKELSALGLVTRSGQIARSAGVNEWLRRGTIDDILPVEPGAEDRLETSRLSVLVSIVDSEYAPPSTGTPGYFGRLAVRFEVL
jgi:hypothetical protein